MANRSPETVAADWRLGALVLIKRDGEPETLVRPAAFVLDVPGGFAWVEPSYADPYGASSTALHVRLGAIEEDRAGLTYQRPGEKISLVPYNPEIDQDLIGDALDWWADYLEASGRTWEEERDQVRALISVD